MARRYLPDLNLLQSFEAAARHSNFSRAADEMNLTQSAISRQIRELEQQVGQQLFERIRKRVVLSDAGRQLLPEARMLLAEGERMVMRALAAQPGRASLRLATLPTFGSRWLVPRLAAFHAQNPLVDLQIESRDRAFSFDEVHIDIAIHYGRPVWPGAICSHLCGETVVPVANRALAAVLQDKGLDQILQQAPLLHLTTRPQLWADWLQREGLAEINAYRGMRFDQFSMIISAVISGLGIGLLPSYLIEGETSSGVLVPLSAAPMATEFNYYVVTPEGGQANPTAQLFQNWIMGQTRRDPV